MTILHLIHKVLLYAFLWAIGIVLSILAILLSPLFACVVDRDGNLPWGFRHLFQPIDNPCWGDMSWVSEHPTWSKWKLSTSYLARNAAYGYQSLVACELTSQTTYGDLTIHDGKNGKAGWYAILADNGCFELVWIYDRGNGKCFRGEYGWSLKDHDSVFAGSLQLVFFLRSMGFQK